MERNSEILPRNTLGPPVATTGPGNRALDRRYARIAAFAWLYLAPSRRKRAESLETAATQVGYRRSDIQVKDGRLGDSPW